MPPPSVADYPALITSRRAQLRAALAPQLAGVTALTLEIGCGHGHFLTAYAAAHPDRACLGLDIAADRIGRAQRKRDRARLEHLTFIHADADDLLADLGGELRQLPGVEGVDVGGPADAIEQAEARGRIRGRGGR